MKEEQVPRFDHYCKTFSCRMRREACILRQLLATHRMRYPLSGTLQLEHCGVYPECYDCRQGRTLARKRGVDIDLLRRRLRSVRKRFQDEEFAASYCIVELTSPAG